jgi:hypothetical protein
MPAEAVLRASRFTAARSGRSTEPRTATAAMTTSDASGSTGDCGHEQRHEATSSGYCPESWRSQGRTTLANVVSSSCSRPVRSPCCDDHEAFMNARARSRRTSAITERRAETTATSCDSEADAKENERKHNDYGCACSHVLPAIRPTASWPSVIANAMRVTLMRNSASASPPHTEVIARPPTAGVGSTTRLARPSEFRSRPRHDRRETMLPRRHLHMESGRAVISGNAARSLPQPCPASRR